MRDAPLARGARRSRGVPDGEIVEQSMTSVAVAGAVGDAVRAEQDRLDVGRVRDADDDDVDVATATSAGVPARATPRSSSSRARPGVRFHAVTVKPARARFAAIAAPIVPRPRNATRSSGMEPSDSVRAGRGCRSTDHRKAGAPGGDSNSRPLGPQPDALSTELRAHTCRRCWRRGGIRTLDAGYPTWRFSKPLH